MPSCVCGRVSFSQQRLESIHFNFTSGERVDFIRWAKVNVRLFIRIALPGGEKASRQFLPQSQGLSGNRLSVCRNLLSSRELSRSMIRRNYRSGISLFRVASGHCVIVVDVAVHENTGEKIFCWRRFTPAECTPVEESKTRNSVPGTVLTSETSFPPQIVVFYKQDRCGFTENEG